MSDNNGIVTDTEEEVVDSTQTVTSPGSLSTSPSICVLSGNQRAAFVSVVLAVIRIIACGSDRDWRILIPSVCGDVDVRRSLYGPTRKLQTQSWQLEYAVTETFSCESNILHECCRCSDGICYQE